MIPLWDKSLLKKLTINCIEPEGRIVCLSIKQERILSFHCYGQHPQICAGTIGGGAKEVQNLNGDEKDDPL